MSAGEITKDYYLLMKTLFGSVLPRSIKKCNWKYGKRSYTSKRM